MSDWLEIHALADEQLDAAEKKRVEDRVAGCAESQKELHAIKSVKSALSSRCDTIDCRATWSRCVKRLDEMDKAHRIESFVGRYSWALCSLFLVFIFGAAMFNRFGGGPRVNASQVPGMAASMAPYLFAPRSQSRSDVVEFQDKAVGRAPVRLQPAESMPSVQVVRGASVFIDGRHHVRIDMLDSGRPVTLVAIQGAKLEGVDPVPGRDGLSQGQVNGRNCVAWIDGDYTVLLMGDESIAELCNLADVVSRS